MNKMLKKTLKIILSKKAIFQMKYQLSRLYYTYLINLKRKSSHSYREKEWGLNLIGPVGDLTGLGEASRSEARSIDAALIPFQIMNHSIESGEVREHDWDNKFGEKLKYGINIFHFNPDALPLAVSKYPKDIWVNYYNIGSWAWELPEIPNNWKPALNLLDEIWVCSEFTRQAVARETNKPVKVFPLSIDINKKPDLSLNQVDTLKKRWDIPLNTFVFFSMYDTDSFKSRKNPEAVVKAFQQAFVKDEKVSLLLKIKVGQKQQHLNHINNLREDNRIIIIEEILDRSDLNDIYKICDSYISLHRAEGFGLSLAEAMSFKKPVIVTGWSGNMDFTKEDNSSLVDYSLVEVGAHFLQGTETQVWAEADINSAAEQMYQLWSDKEYYSTISKMGFNYISQNLSPKVIGSGIRKRILEIYEFTW
ncbi:MAG: glycosyltransferase family 4 protein [Bacteroidetes bacterium]|nr:glycosyltransferase family 4 protein [Bacteroidota bacterium]